MNTNLVIKRLILSLVVKLRVRPLQHSTQMVRERKKHYVKSKQPRAYEMVRKGGMFGLVWFGLVWFGLSTLLVKVSM